jgi:hypothetical protein
VKAYVTRDSVCAGDDIDPPHGRVVLMPETDSLEVVVQSVVASYALPVITGGAATWCLGSLQPIALIAQQWSAPKLISWNPELSRCKIVDGLFLLHFSYFAQTDPDLVLEVLKRLRLVNY